MRLVVAIPALNEELSIESIVTRTLAARENIVAATDVDAVEITVVSDGSTDRTVELAQGFADQIDVIVFEKNRGYGAAIMEAWRASDAELMAFLDADGTCDPEFFVPLCNTLAEENLDVVLGCRMTPHSRMPMVRRLGNTVFATMLTLFSSTRVRDTASGMRVVRRESLPALMPLPTGLHFTPAMSARAILSDDLRIGEVDMTYAEREGRSKLSVVRDGLRFLRVIVESAFLYRPARPLGLVGVLMGVLGVGLMVMPTLFYAQNARVEEWMIYRFVVGHLLGVGSALLFAAAYLSGKISLMTLSASQARRGWWWVERTLKSPFFYLLPAALVAAGGALVVPSFVELTLTGATYEHWSRFIIMSLCLSLALVMVVTKAIDWVLDLIRERLDYLSKS